MQAQDDARAAALVVRALPLSAHPFLWSTTDTQSDDIYSPHRPHPSSQPAPHPQCTACPHKGCVSVVCVQAHDIIISIIVIVVVVVVTIIINNNIHISSAAY
eukprot:1192472-Prorocentrum_minimum.AAC.1